MAAHTANGKGNYRVIPKLAHEAIDLLGIKSPDLSETVKTYCAQRHVPYDSRTVGKAIDSALIQRKRRK